MANFLLAYRCIECGREFDPLQLNYLCPDCSRDYKPGMPLKGVLEAVFDYKKIARKWKTKPDPLLLSAVDPKFYPPLPVGNTPLYRPSNHPTFKPSNLLLKLDSHNPSGSYKDRASQLVVADATQKGINEIVAASTGNAASSLACLAASAGKKAVIFAPESAPPAKLIQIQAHGATLNKVKGSYDDAFKAALEYTVSHNCLCRNTGYHPLTVDGKKSSGLEIFLQCGKQVPDWIVIPVGDGVILTGIYKAFLDLQRAGVTDRLPRLLCVQAESSDAITGYWETGVYQDAAKPDTCADSISVRTPALGHWAVLALWETDGKAQRVSENEIHAAQLELARNWGVFAEPSSSATLAGLKKAMQKGWIKPQDKVVLMITGHGLKDPGAVKL
jgi:threonine synthase